MKIQPIVEGHGEVEAVPILLRRLRDEAKAFEIEIGRPIRRPASDLIRKEGIQRAVQLARLQSECGAILVLFDSEDSCPKELAPRLQRWASEAAVGIPCGVVLAHREYEAWFLASLNSLRGKCGIREDAEPFPFPEGPRGAKEAVESQMRPSASYDEIVDQPSLTAQFDMAMAFRGSRSFRKLVNSFGSLVHGMGVKSLLWPPAWAEEK